MTTVRWLREQMTQQERELEEDRKTKGKHGKCDGCTFDHHYHPFYCGVCRRGILKEIAALQEKLKHAYDNWRDAEKHPWSNFFDMR